MKTYPLSSYIMLLAFSFPALAAPPTERKELTLPLNQLTQIEASLNHAQQSVRADINERYYFDCLHIHNDITTLCNGIENYLTPIRAQPRDTATLVG